VDGGGGGTRCDARGGGGGLADDAEGVECETARRSDDANDVVRARGAGSGAIGE